MLRRFLLLLTVAALGPRVTLLALSSVICLGFALVTLGQETLVPQVIAVEPIKSEAPSKNAGLFIGVNEFQDKELPALDYAVNDALALAYLSVVELKLIPPRNCRLLLSGEPTRDRMEHLAKLKSLGVTVAPATKFNIVEALGALKEIGGDLVLMSISSHGLIDRGIAYVIPSDGSRADIDETALKLLSVDLKLEQTEARNRLLLIDACQERIPAKNIAGDPTAAMSEAFAKALKESRGQFKVASCKPGELSREDRQSQQGVFTDAVLRALRGEAVPRPKDNIVDLESVLKSVATTLSALPKDRKQTLTIYGEDPARSMPLAIRGSDTRQLMADLKKKVSEKGFTFEQYDQLAAALPKLNRSQVADQEFLEETRSFAAGRLSEKLFLLSFREWFTSSSTDSLTSAKNEGDVREVTAFRVYIGTYTSEKSKGIYTGRLDMASGALTDIAVAGEIENPSFLAIHPSGKHLYAVGELSNVGGKATGAVSALAIGEDGRLTLLNQQSSEGAGPCHLVIDKTGRHVLVANYGGGSVASLPIQEGGKLGSATSAIPHEGKSVNLQRQERPHAHSINLDPSNRVALAADLGLDQVLIYRFDAATGKLSKGDPPHAKVVAGSGPRHLAFHPSGKFAWVINEISNTVTGFEFHDGTLAETQTIGTLPKEFKGTSHTAEVVVHSSGKFLYGSNRGHDSLAIYLIDEKTGKLTATGHRLTGGKTPRNFAIEPTGQYLLAENQASDTIVVFRIDQKTGALKQVGEPIKVSSPVCVRFLAME